MSITEVLRSENKPEEKLEAIVNIVNEVRKSYGNVDSVIEVPEVHTATGLLPLSALSNESKVTLADNEVQNITVQVLEILKEVPGTNPEKIAESLIAVNPILVNLSEKVSLGAL